MSPTVFRYKSYRFHFFSREEKRMHVHISANNGEAKFRLEPEISLAVNHRLSSREIRKLQNMVEERRDEIIQYWHEHFGND
ncbi:MAG: DUF4160 domain-containing protein [bacterium]|nr:DUF4160 domain-containing protein [bacterium]